MSIVEMRVPTIGESITEVTLSAWLKSDGEFVNLDEPICEFESDKATLEFPAEASGKLTYVAAEGDDLEIGALVAKIDTSVSGPSASEEENKEEENKEEAKPEKAEAPVEEEKENYATGHPSPA
ncbi:MAG: dihydrolipoyllysine-residue succinyltransferase, partial [Bacteroidia bacterium]|nr:dihydrolipoyllysine-residue succinyltransferase [Bacteroidia bacterium]